MAKNPARHDERRLIPKRALLVAAVLVAGLGVWGVRVLLGRRPAHPNFILITIDTLRADRVGCYGYRGAETPVLDSLAAQGVRFDVAQTAVPITGPAHATILTGVDPPVHGLRDNELLALSGRPTLASLLKAQGYRTAAFVGGYPVASEFGFAQGFDHFDDAFRREGRTERPADQVADAATRWLAQATEPFFVWVHLYDPHTPYAPPPPYRERLSPYDGEVAFADAQIGRVLGALDAGGRRRRTVVMALADHGEGLGDHGEATHGILVYESTVRIPWIVAGPDVPRGRVVRDRAATLDVVPTALGILGLESPSSLPGRDRRSVFADGSEVGASNSPGFYGESLLGNVACRWAPLRTWTEGEWKLILGAGAELYNLRADPGEKLDLAARDGERVVRMQQALQTAITRMAALGSSGGGARLSPEQEERLRSLGYLSGSAAVPEARSSASDLPDPRHRVSVYERLQALIAEPDRAGTLDEARDIAGRESGNPAAQYTLALLAQRSGDLALSARSLERTLAVDSRPAVRDTYGRVLREIGRLDESERQLREALAVPGPYDVRLRLNLAETLVALGKWDAARQLLRDVLQRDPGNAQAQTLLGRTILGEQRP